jgi:hypothetical protein
MLREPAELRVTMLAGPTSADGPAFLGLLPIEWVIFRNSDVMAVFDDDTLADRWSLL